MVTLTDKSGLFPEITIFLINLEERSDRLKTAESEAEKLNLNLTRIPAVSASTQLQNRSPLSPPALACWSSHKLAMTEFLKTDMSHCIIAEDDFYVKNFPHFARQVRAIDITEFDFIQLGYLNTGLLDRTIRVLTNVESMIFILLSKLLSHFSRYKNRLRVKRNCGIPIHWVVDDIRAGAHFYIVSRKFAIEVLEFNEPAFLTADGFYMAIAWDKHFRMIRTRRSAINQSNSPSSIKNHGLGNLENEL